MFGNNLARKKTGILAQVSNYAYVKKGLTQNLFFEREYFMK